MSRIILLSDINQNNRSIVVSWLFLATTSPQVFAYMPSDGATYLQKYTPMWEQTAKDNGAEFLLIDNKAEDKLGEINKIDQANVLLLTGGNTFQLLKNLKTSGLDQKIKEMAQRPNMTICGFSAGALVLGPDISVCLNGVYDPNECGLQDFSALGLVDFYTLPHFDENRDVKYLEQFKKDNKYPVYPLSDDEYITVDEGNFCKSRFG